LKAVLILVLLMTFGCSEDDGVEPSDSVAPASVADLANSVTSDSSATLTWEAPGDDGSLGTAAEYDIRYSTAVITDANFSSATRSSNAPVPSTAGTREVFTLTGLKEETTYYFALKSADKAWNWSGLSNVSSATTRSAAPPEFVLKWGSQGSADGQFDFPLRIAVDGGGDIFVAELDNQRIQKFDNTGTFLAKSRSGQLNRPEGVAVDGRGYVYVTDGTIVRKFDWTWTLLTQWGSQGDGDGEFGLARGIAVGPNGNVYVADEGNARIQKFDNWGTFLAKWGSRGSGDAQFQTPTDVAVDGSGNVYVVDRTHDRVQKFSSTGTFLAKWGSSGSGEGQFNFPIGISVDGANAVYVADQGNHRIQKFSSTGAFLTEWGMWGSGDGQFANVFDVAVDGSGNVYVTDFGHARVQRFRE
jgi:sugar lactone lactonase YvrE